MSEILVSAIVPVYNLESYLPACLDSALSQTLGDALEIICIDDGSTDASPRILEEYARRSERVRVIHQANSGPSAARNAGLDAARGAYLFNLDGDDRFAAPDALERLCARAAEDDLDMLFFEASVSYESEELRAATTEPPDFYRYHHTYPRCVDGQELYLLLEKRGEYRSSNWIYLLRRALVEENGLRFPVGIFHEDEVFTLAALSLAKRTSCAPICAYDRLWRADSTMSRRNPFHRIRGNLLAGRAMLEFGRERLSGARPRFLRRYNHHARAINLRGANQYAKLSEADRRAFLNGIDPRERGVIRVQLRRGSRTRLARKLRRGVKRLIPAPLLAKLRAGR